MGKKNTVVHYDHIVIPKIRSPFSQCGTSAKVTQVEHVDVRLRFSSDLSHAHFLGFPGISDNFSLGSINPGLLTKGVLPQ